MYLDSFGRMSHLCQVYEPDAGLREVSSRATTFYELLLAADRLRGGGILLSSCTCGVNFVWRDDRVD